MPSSGHKPSHVIFRLRLLLSQLSAAPTLPLCQLSCVCVHCCQIQVWEHLLYDWMIEKYSLRHRPGQVILHSSSCQYFCYTSAVSKLCRSPPCGNVRGTSIGYFTHHTDINCFQTTYVAWVSCWPLAFQAAALASLPPQTMSRGWPEGKAGHASCSRNAAC